VADWVQRWTVVMTGTYCCPRCKGAGVLSLSNALKKTMSDLKGMEDMTATAGVLAKCAGMSVQAVHNRLCRLEGFGLVERAGKGGGACVLWRLILEE